MKTKRRSRNEHHKRLAEIRNRTQQSLQTCVSFYLLNKMLRNVGIILLVQFAKYLESFRMISSVIRYIRHKQFGLVFIETPCTCTMYVRQTYENILAMSVWTFAVWNKHDVTNMIKQCRLPCTAIQYRIQCMTS